MENLNLLLVNRFDEILEVMSQPEDLCFDVYIRTCVHVPVFVNKLNHYILRYLKSNNWHAEPVYFKVYQNRELMNDLRYNDPDRFVVPGRKTFCCADHEPINSLFTTYSHGL